MPYSIVKTNNGYQVRKKHGGKIVAGNKTKLSKERAKKVIAAIYANEK